MSAEGRFTAVEKTAVFFFEKNCHPRLLLRIHICQRDKRLKEKRKIKKEIKDNEYH